MSRTTPYNPADNGQVEKQSGIIRESILLQLKTKNLPEDVLSEVLHANCSLLCITTHYMPHE